jgi:hypothetical protein
MSGVAAAGAVSRKLKKVSVPSAILIVAKPPPPMLPQQGCTTASAYPTATAASTALPPARRMSAPTPDATCCAVTTMPFGAFTGGGDAAHAAPERPIVSAASAARIMAFIRISLSASGGPRLRALFRHCIHFEVR